LLRILRISPGPTGQRGRTVPRPVRTVPQVSVAHDIIAVEHATRLMAAQFHRDGEPSGVIRNFYIWMPSGQLACWTAPASATGRKHRNVAPPATLFSALIDPRCAPTIERLIARPRPRP